MIKTYSLSTNTGKKRTSLSPSFQPAFTDDTFQKIKEFVYQQSGIFLSTNRKKIIEKRLLNRLNDLKLSDFEKYYKFLLHKEHTKQELPYLIDAITVNETKFFRNQAHINAFIEAVIPDILERKRKAQNPSIKILSVGCSSGEEPYTLAIILNQYFPDIWQNYKTNILGTDINTKILEQAKRGLYDEFTVQKMDSSVLDGFFQKKGLKCQLNPDIRKLVEFKAVNLIDEQQMSALGHFDLILCRNVLIYLDEKARKQAARILYNNLNPDGYLFLGHSESLHGISKSFKLIHFIKTMGYKKSGQDKKS